MVQLQVVLDFSDKKINIQVNKLSREDALPAEQEVAKHLEQSIFDTLMEIAKSTGLELSELYGIN